MIRELYKYVITGEGKHSGEWRLHGRTNGDMPSLIKFCLISVSPTIRKWRVSETRGNVLLTVILGDDKKTVAVMSKELVYRLLKSINTQNS